jgi:hypothetical protein
MPFVLQWSNGRSRKNKGRRSPQLLGDSLITPPAKDDDMEHLKQNSQVRLVSSPAPLAHRFSVADLFFPLVVLLSLHLYD